MTSSTGRMITIASHLNFGAEKLGMANMEASATFEKLTIPVRSAATYPTMMEIRIGITDRNPRNTTEPSTAVSSVARNTITFLISMDSTPTSFAFSAAFPASSRPMSATTGPIAAGGSTISIQSEPNLYMISASTQPRNPTATKPPRA